MVSLWNPIINEKTGMQEYKMNRISLMSLLVACDEYVTTFFMQNSTEHDIYPGNEYLNANNWHL